MCIRSTDPISKLNSDLPNEQKLLPCERLYFSEFWPSWVCFWEGLNGFLCLRKSEKMSILSSAIQRCCTSTLQSYEKWGLLNKKKLGPSRVHWPLKSYRVEHSDRRDSIFSAALLNAVEASLIKSSLAKYWFVCKGKKRTMLSTSFAPNGLIFQFRQRGKRTRAA